MRCGGIAASGFLAGTPLAAQRDVADPTWSDIIVTAGHASSLATVAQTGSRLGLSLLETPASISVLSGETVRQRGDLSIVDAVTRAPGITSVANPGNGGTALAARGFGGQGSVLQLYDGVRLFPVAGTITFPVDPWNVDRIEVLSGPASVLYGQGALGGAVNVVTKQPNADHARIDGEASFGSQETAHVAAGASGPVGQPFSYRVDASYRRSDGYVDRGGSRGLALSGALRFTPDSTLAVTLRDDYGNQRPTEYFGTPLIAGRLLERNYHRNYNVADAELHYRDNRTALTVDWTVSDVISISNVAYRLTSKRLFKDLESYFYNSATRLIDRSDNLGIVHDQTQYGDQGTIKISVPLARGIDNDLAVGFDFNTIKLIYSNDFGSVAQNDSVDPFNFEPGTFFDTQGIAPRFRTRTREYSVYAEDRVKLGEQVSLVGGIRSERDRVERWNISYNAAGAAGEASAYPNAGAKRLRNTTWRVGGVYQPIPAISLYGQYSTGVDPLGTLTTYSPNASQFYFTNAKGDQVEAGAKASFLGGRGSATLAAYRIVKKNLVAQRTPSSPVEQVGQRSARGIEASIAFELPKGFGVDANGTVLDARYDDFISGGADYSGRTPPKVAQASANLWLTWTTSRLQARAGLRYVGHSYSDNANTFRVPGYTVVDAGASYAITPQLALDLRIYNLFDMGYATNSYNDEQWILGRPRSIDLAIRARF